MRHLIEAILNSENVRYFISLVLAAITAYSAMWHSVNKNTYELKSQNKEISHNTQSINKTNELIDSISADITEIKIMLARMEGKQ